MQILSPRRRIALFLTVSILLCTSLSSSSVLAQVNDCKCIYEVDETANGSEYFVLKKDLETSCKVMVLSRSNIASTYLEKLKTGKGYRVIGRYKTFEGAKFMAIGECSNCQ